MDTVSNYTETLEKTVRDLLERQDDLIRTAFTDQLTGLGNRGGFARSLEELWEQDIPVTTAFIDIDNLKHCNDVFGHDEGNRYILQVSLYLKLYMKVDEAAFRIGGDEFAILSTIATEDDLAERLEHCRTILLKNNDSEMPHSFSYGVSHADPALGEAPNRMTLDADHRMYDYKLRHAMHLDRRNITQVHADDFEISDRIFDAFSMLNEGRYFFIENLDKHRTLWSQGALRDLGLPPEHIDNCRDYWKTRVHPDDLEAFTDDIDKSITALNTVELCSTAYAMPPATTSSAVLAGFVSTATEMSPRSMSARSSTTHLPKPSTPPQASERSVCWSTPSMPAAATVARRGL